MAINGPGFPENHEAHMERGRASALRQNYKGMGTLSRSKWKARCNGTIRRNVGRTKTGSRSSERKDCSYISSRVAGVSSSPDSTSAVHIKKPTQAHKGLSGLEPLLLTNTPPVACLLQGRPKQEERDTRPAPTYSAPQLRLVVGVLSTHDQPHGGLRPSRQAPIQV